MKYKTEVAIVRPSEYENIEKAITAALELIGAEKLIKSKDKILLKPNLLVKLKNACTEDDFIQGVARYLKKYNKNIMIGDSPGQFGQKGKDVMKALSIDKILEQEKITYTEFESGTAHEVENSKAELMRKYHIAPAIHEADIIINLPRPKSHMEAVYTGAIKNYWGIIPGGDKARCHLYGKNPAAFGAVLADNYETLIHKCKKRITIMDARKIMEGLGGPAAGFMRDTDLLLAGFDETAVDMVMLAIGHHDGVATVPHLKSCRDRGIGTTNLNEIKILGKSIEEVKLKRKFKLPSHGLSGLITLFTGNIFYKIVRRMPKLVAKKCVKCGDCFNICPAKAIKWEVKQYPEYNIDKCISCLCCVECCPEQALKAKPIGLKGFTIKEPQIVLPE